ncbi:MAG: hypothetical protein WCS37_00835 [Chloroflexota bacterium]|nr:hypothetical protein [Chloroflexota bacterium]
MSYQHKHGGPRCAGCGRQFVPRQLRDGSWSQTCGQTACVALFNRRKSTDNNPRTTPRQPQKLGNY